MLCELILYVSLQLNVDSEQLILKKLFHGRFITDLLGLRPSFSHKHIKWVNFIREWRDLQFKVDSERHISFMSNLFARRVFARNLLVGSHRRIFFFIISFWRLIWGLSRVLTSNKREALPIRFQHFNRTTDF